MRKLLRGAGLALLTGGLVALPSLALSDDGSAHSVPQALPIQLGSTGSTQTYLSMNGQTYCFAGTLGALVEESGGAQHILSNNHVLAQSNQMSLGEPIIHPGSGDNGCSNVGAATVGTLSSFVEIQFCQPFRGFLYKCADNVVDAALAATNRNGAQQVEPNGSILDIGPPGTASVAPALGMTVQKSGRTTGWTTGTVAAVNVTVNVCYFDPCSDLSNVARFVNQIRIDGAFSASGDSGSMIFQCNDDGSGGCMAAPNATALLFAGGTNTTFANPIPEVFSALNVAMAGCGSTCFGTGSGGGKGGGSKPGKGNSKASGAGAGSLSQSPDPILEIANEVRNRNAEALHDLPGVMGSGIGVDAAGEPVIEIYVKDATGAPDRPIPSHVEGIPVRMVVTGQVRAY